MLLWIVACLSLSLSCRTEPPLDLSCAAYRFLGLATKLSLHSHANATAGHVWLWIFGLCNGVTQLRQIHSRFRLGVLADTTHDPEQHPTTFAPDFSTCSAYQTSISRWDPLRGCAHYCFGHMSMAIAVVGGGRLRNMTGRDRQYARTGANSLSNVQHCLIRYDT